MSEVILNKIKKNKFNF